MATWVTTYRPITSALILPSHRCITPPPPRSTVFPILPFIDSTYACLPHHLLLRHFDWDPGDLPPPATAVCTRLPAGSCFYYYLRTCHTRLIYFGHKLLPTSLPFFVRRWPLVVLLFLPFPAHRARTTTGFCVLRFFTTFVLPVDFGTPATTTMRALLPVHHTFTCFCGSLRIYRVLCGCPLPITVHLTIPTLPLRRLFCLLAEKRTRIIRLLPAAVTTRSCAFTPADVGLLPTPVPSATCLWRRWFRAVLLCGELVISFTAAQFVLPPLRHYVPTRCASAITTSWRKTPCGSGLRGSTTPVPPPDCRLPVTATCWANCFTAADTLPCPPVPGWFTCGRCLRYTQRACGLPLPPLRVLGLVLLPFCTYLRLCAQQRSALRLPPRGSLVWRNAAGYSTARSLTTAFTTTTTTAFPARSAFTCLALYFPFCLFVRLKTPHAYEAYTGSFVDSPCGGKFLCFTYYPVRCSLVLLLRSRRTFTGFGLFWFPLPVPTHSG